MNIPSADVFDAHGLFDIDVDLSTTRDLGQSATGWATYRPTSRSPLINKELEGRFSDKTVRFYWCATDDHEAAQAFKRTCQIWAIETLARRDEEEHCAAEEQKSLLAWWEHDGLWMIVDEPKVETVSLSEWWTRRLADQQTSPVDGPSQNQVEVHKRDSQGRIYADFCDLFVSLAHCNQRIHRKHLIFLSTRLNAYGVIQQRPAVVEVCKWPDAFALAELSLPCLIEGSVLAECDLFAQCTLDRSNRLDDRLVKQYLRYLAPEVVGSRQLNIVSDIFAIGVVMYELLTGQTIDGGPETPDVMTVDVLQDFQRHVLLEVPPPHVLLDREAKIGSYQAELPPTQLSTIIMKCIAKDVEDRYGSIDAMCYDLTRLGQVIRNKGELSKFQVGAVDRISRFALPTGILHRSEELAHLSNTLSEASSLADTEAWSSRAVTVYGLSGAGKSRMLLEWVRRLEAQGQGRTFLVSYAKVDEHISRPLASFTQLFESLLERIFADGKEDVEAWRKRITDVLGTHMDTFLRLLSPSSQRLVAPERRVLKPTDSIEWTNFLPAFQTWSSRLLQLFGTQSRPLVLIIDDCQWLESGEVTMWRNLLEGDSALDFVLVAASYRVEDDLPPPTSTLLSTTGSQIHIRRLPEEGVAEFVNACFHQCLDKSGNLVSFLYAETDGSPLYLRSLLSILVSSRASVQVSLDGTLTPQVRENVIYFDFDMLMWRYDPLALQGHLTNRQVDAFLGKILRGFTGPVQEALVILSCLPSIGVPTYLLADILGQSLLDVETSLSVSDAAGCTTSIETARGLTTKFSHDRYRMAAHHLVPAQEQAATLNKVSAHLGTQALREEYLLVAADLALSAKEKGCSGSLDEFMSLMLAASEKSSQHASFPAAKRFLDGYESVIEHAGGLESVLRDQRDGYFQYLRLVSEVYGVLKIASEADEKIRSVISYCQSPAEEVKLALYRVRIKIWNSRYAEAMELLLDTLRRQGYDPDHPEKLKLRVPRTLDQVWPFIDGLEAKAYKEEEDVRILLATLICIAGSTIFVTLPTYWKTIFTLAVSLIGDVGILQETTAYLLSVYALSITDIAVRQAICEAAQKFAIDRPGSQYSSSALVGIAAQVHCWSSLAAVEASMSPAFDLTFAHGSYEIAAYVLALDLGTQIFASRPIDWKQAGLRYKPLKSVASKVMKATMEIPLQYAECLSTYSPDRPPWDMEGTFLADSSAFRNLSLQEAMWHCCSLRLAILYDAPLDVQMEIINKGHVHTAAAAPLVYGPEWEFLCALTLLRRDSKDQRISQARKTLETLSRNVDFANSAKVLDALAALYEDAYKGIKVVDALLRELADGFTNLHGLLSLLTGQHILETTASEALAAGYFINAAKSLVAIGGRGVRHMLSTRFPTYIAPTDTEKEATIPSLMKGGTVPTPVLRRAPPSTSNDTSHSDVPFEEDTNQAENLDTITLMRSSLALASEHDPQVLMATLLRVLCQYVRADYAAIALADPEDAAAFRLVASGTYDRITTRDLLLADESAHRVCPAPLMLKVARTNKAMTKMSTSSRDWFDSFYGNKTPRTAICLPISAQGRQAGVILLSSMVVDNPRARSAAAREVVSCLATFATLVAINQSFTRRLKREVDERTKQLRDALAAKTQFLSQCSHELRSPLSAVLGLATVLRESPGLSEVQREHLQTIQSSGEDLLGLINNILDVSRLENSSVTLERTPFSIRDVVEAALDTLASSAQTKDLEVCLISSFKSDPPGVYGDSFRVKQVLLNLLSNAVKFTSKGKVTVRWKYEEKPDNRVMISLIVEDTGIGIPAQKMDKLFQTFSQVDESITRSYGGSGLGLVISRDLARLMGGDCSAESEYGKGSKFTFSFLAERNDEAKTDYEVFRSPRSCFVLCPLGPSWPMLEANLTAFNCQPVRFEAELQQSLEKDFPEGLNSDHDFHFVFVDVDMLDQASLDEMRRLQPKATFVYMCNSIQLAKAMKRFNLTRESILARPIKLASLYNVLIPAGDANTPNRPKMQGRSRNSANKVNKRLAEEAPLSILLVDDNNTNLLVGRRILEMLGYKDIPSASDGLQGFEQAEKKQYDLILMDLQMPVMDGFTSLARIQESPLTGSPCVVALTANADMATQKRCEEAGFFTYLSKPLAINKFETTLRTVHQHRQLHRTEHKIDKSSQPGKDGDSVKEPTAVNSKETVKES